MKIDRRNFLKFSGLGVASGFAANLASFNAFAADTSDYKALVCVFFRGGMDTHDLVIPYDSGSSQAYESIRAQIIDGYAGNGFESRRRDNLLTLNGLGNGTSGTVADGREFALPKEMLALHNLYSESKVAFIGNVGPLIEPTSSQTLSNGGARTPARLFSHNDQQSTWLASSTEGATEGWGGRFGDIVAEANANQLFTTVATAKGDVFVNGLNVTGFNLSSNGGELVRSLNGSFEGSSHFGEAYANSLYGLNENSNNLFKQDVGVIRGKAIDANQLVRSQFSVQADPVTIFPGSSIGDQLKVVAKMIASRSDFGMSRQIFIVTDDGYDTHSNQTSSLPIKHQEISDALAAFYQETVAMGISEKVTTFTGSDFGRSLVPNSSGTDHGWGSHHIVMGGAVNGGQILGNIPEAVLGHNQDAGRGRLIPEISVDQYAKALGRWFGLTDSECLSLFPNLNNMDVNALNDLFV